MSACHMGGLCCKQNPCAYLAPDNSVELDERDAEIAALRAQVERLREALANMVEQWGQEPCPVCGGDCASANPPISMCPVIAVMRARAALGAKR